MEAASAPMAGAARNKPRPQGPTIKISLANMGSKAVAPPNSTANKSSEMAPSKSLLCHTKCTPAKTVRKVAASLVTTCR